MNSPYRRSLDELLTRYDFEPSIRDVYVEGEFDKRLLDWFLSACKCNAVTYSVDSVDVPDGVVTDFGLPRSGNRGRVHALALFLSGRLPADKENIFCVIDKDFGVLEAIVPVCRFLHVTDFAAMECYVLDDVSLDKFFRVYLGRPFERQRVEELLDVVSRVFLARRALMEIAPNRTFVETFQKSCSITPGGIVFDCTEYLTRVALAAGIALAELEGKFAELLAKGRDDLRDYISGHHLVSALSWYAARIGVDRSMYDERPLARALVMAVTAEKLAGYKLFDALGRWAASA